MWMNGHLEEVPFIACTYVLRIAHLNYLRIPLVNPYKYYNYRRSEKYALKKSETKKITIFLFE